MSDDTDSPDNGDEDDENSRAGFQINLPGIKVWGGPKELREFWPFLKWMLISVAAGVAAWELSGLFK